MLIFALLAAFRVHDTRHVYWILHFLCCFSFLFFFFKVCAISDSGMSQDFVNPNHQHCNPALCSAHINPKWFRLRLLWWDDSYFHERAAEKNYMKEFDNQAVLLAVVTYHEKSFRFLWKLIQENPPLTDSSWHFSNSFRPWLCLGFDALEMWL